VTHIKWQKLISSPKGSWIQYAVHISIFQLILACALQQCSANALPVIGLRNKAKKN